MVGLVFSREGELNTACMLTTGWQMMSWYYFGQCQPDEFMASTGHSGGSLDQTRCMPLTEASYVDQVNDRKENDTATMNHEVPGRNDIAF
jgi:hypothetical protein